jgi:SAM-dependent methyltransferase
MELPASVVAVLAGYERDAASLLVDYEAVPPADKLRWVADLIPTSPRSIADVGAGSGADAAWLAVRGHSVLAIEPVEALRLAGAILHPCERIEWLDDALPSLAKARTRAGHFDLVLVSAVWHHLHADLWEEALVSIGRMTRPGGTVLMSLRNGPGAARRPTFPVSPERILDLAARHGLRTIRRVRAESMQQRNRDAGVTWDWLAFESPAE